MENQILTWILGLVAAFLAVQWNIQSEKVKKLNDILNDKKIKIYTQVIDLLFELMNGVKYKDKTDLAVQEMRQINKELILFASPTVYKIYGDWFSNLYGANDFNKTLRYLGELMCAMRKDVNIDGNFSNFLWFDALRPIIKDINDYLPAQYQKERSIYSKSFDLITKIPDSAIKEATSKL
jgi:hypothetical protein